MLKQIIEDWEKESDNYELLCVHIKKILDDFIQNEGIFSNIDYRVKKPANLAIKLLKDKLDCKEKGIDTTFDNLYRNLSDKAGLRIICRYSNEITQITNIIKKQFDVLNEDNKISHLDYNQMGYKSYHLDVKLRENNTPHDIYLKLGNLVAEIQVRTLCENVWAEVDHDIGYKPKSDVQYEIRRQIHCLGGLFEIADDSLSQIYVGITTTVKVNEEYLLRILEPFFIKYFKTEYDRDLSLRTLTVLKKFFELSSPKEFEASLKVFLKQNEDQISFFAKHYSQKNIENPYLTQPEILLIFYLLRLNRHSLIDIWESEFFIEDLEKIGELWGISISDII